MGFDYHCNFKAEDLLTEIGLNESGRVQQVIDEEVIRVCEPFTPFVDGDLVKSATTNTVIGSGEIIWDVEDKARRLYYGEESWKWSNGGVQDGGLRGPYWVARAMDAGGREQVINAAKEELKK